MSLGGPRTSQFPEVQRLIRLSQPLPEPLSQRIAGVGDETSRALRWEVDSGVDAPGILSSALEEMGNAETRRPRVERAGASPARFDAADASGLQLTKQSRQLLQQFAGTRVRRRFDRPVSV